MSVQRDRINQARINAGLTPLPETHPTAITMSKARTIINQGGEAYAVYGDEGRALFDDYDEASEYAEAHGATHVLDWETGEYA